MKRILSLAALVATASLGQSVRADQIYRWTDGNGLIHFSSQPPASGNYERITPAPPPPTAAPGIDSIKQRSQNLDAESGSVKKARQEALLAKAQDAEKCAKARERLSYLDAHPAHRLYTVGANGEEARMTDEQHDAEVAKARGVAKDSCN